MASLSNESTPRERLARLLTLVRRTRRFRRSALILAAVGVALGALRRRARAAGLPQRDDRALSGRHPDRRGRGRRELGRPRGAARAQAEGSALRSAQPGAGDPRARPLPGEDAALDARRHRGDGGRRRLPGAGLGQLRDLVHVRRSGGGAGRGLAPRRADDRRVQPAEPGQRHPHARLPPAQAGRGGRRRRRGEPPARAVPRRAPAVPVGGQRLALRARARAAGRRAPAVAPHAAARSPPIPRSRRWSGSCRGWRPSCRRARRRRGARRRGPTDRSARGGEGGARGGAAGARGDPAQGDAGAPRCDRGGGPPGRGPAARGGSWTRPATRRPRRPSEGGPSPARRAELSRLRASLRRQIELHHAVARPRRAGAAGRGRGSGGIGGRAGDRVAPPPPRPRSRAGEAAHHPAEHARRRSLRRRGRRARATRRCRSWSPPTCRPGPSTGAGGSSSRGPPWRSSSPLGYRGGARAPRRHAARRRRRRRRRRPRGPGGHASPGGAPRAALGARHGPRRPHRRRSRGRRRAARVRRPLGRPLAARAGAARRRRPPHRGGGVRGSGGRGHRRLRSPRRRRPPGLGPSGDPGGAAHPPPPPGAAPGRRPVRGLGDEPEPRRGQDHPGAAPRGDPLGGRARPRHPGRGQLRAARAWRRRSACVSPRRPASRRSSTIAWAAAASRGG